GGSGTDIAVFSGSRLNYQITYDNASDTCTVSDQRAGSPDGTDHLAGIEKLRFADGDLNLVIGRAGNDTLNGTSGDDWMAGGAGGDLIWGGAGNDVLDGGDGNNNLVGGLGADIYKGGSGFDIANLYWLSPGVMDTTGVTANMADPSQNTGAAAGDIYLNIERLYGTQADDILIGDAGNNSLWGDTGNDTISAGAGDDTLVGYDGNDTL